jgi:benzil reductase ((S)-benzoin forming)
LGSSARTTRATHLALVTGTTSGIGEAIARLLLERGWRVVGLARRAASIQNPNYTHVSVDLGDAAALSAAFAASVAPLVQSAGLKRFALVNNAADVALYGQLSDVTAADMLHAYTVNSVAPVLLMGLVTRHVAASTAVRIVNVSTAAARAAFPGLGTYAMTKAALRLAGMVMAGELQLAPAPGAGRDISILSYEPGVVDTPMQLAARSSSPSRLPIVDVFNAFKANGDLVAPELPARDVVSYIEADGHPPFSEDELSAGR